MLYEPDEKVLCFHGPLIYQAKVRAHTLTQILLAEEWKGDDNQNGAVGPHFLVHYQGWKKTWDEWVPETRLLKYNEENLARQKALVEAQKSAANAAAQASTSSDANTHASAKREGRKPSSSVGGRGTKRSRESTDQDELERRPEIKLVIPEALKVQLVDDWENVTRKEQLVPLPRKPNVCEILDEYGASYRAQHKTKPGESSAVLDEVLAGLKLYFDKSLAQNLLYRFERAQYVELRKQHVPKMGDGDVSAGGRGDAKSRGGRKSAGAAAAPEDDAPAMLEMEPSKIYGAEHLLRLFGACFSTC